MTQESSKCEKCGAGSESNPLWEKNAKEMIENHWQKTETGYLCNICKHAND